MLFSDIIIKYRYPKHCFCFVPIKLVDNGRTSGYKKFYNFLTECKYLGFLYRNGTNIVAIKSYNWKPKQFKATFNYRFSASIVKKKISVVYSLLYWPSLLKTCIKCRNSSVGRALGSLFRSLVLACIFRYI